MLSLTTALHIGFEMAEYIVEEGGKITIDIIQENDLEFSQDFHVILRLNSESNGTEGRHYYGISLVQSNISKQSLFCIFQVRTTHYLVE